METPAAVKNKGPEREDAAQPGQGSARDDATPSDQGSSPADASKTDRGSARDVAAPTGHVPTSGDSMAKKLLRFNSATILILALLAFELTLLVLVVMLVFGFITLDVRGAAAPLFQLLPLILMVGWLALLTGYLAWCTHFYNYNFGRSEAFWKKFVDRVREAEAEGLTENDVYEELAAPRQNPYAAQTFGIPPGTVRGSIAITILVAALGLLISLFGGSQTAQEYFAFFQDAFLMVVAFYFGTKGLAILQGERSVITQAAPERASGPGERPAKPSAEAAPTGDGRPAPSDGHAAETTVLPASAAGTRGKVLEMNYPHISDLATEAPEPTRATRELEPADFEEFAAQYDLEIPVVRAVVEVESGGRGFWSDGRPKILFEGHVFWRQLKERDIDPNKFAPEHPTILYSKWTRAHYKGGPAEYERLAAAKLIDEAAALSSASWGLFQIMGYHATSLKYDDVFQFVEQMNKTEREHLEAFGRFLERNDLIGFLRQKQWASFARRYNGPGYAENRYDEKLQKSYVAHKVQREGSLVA